MAERLFTISTVAFVFAGVFLSVAIVLWFRFGVLGIINELSGRTARKSIELIRENNSRNEKKVFRINTVSGRSRRLLEKTAEIAVWQDSDTTEKLVQVKDNALMERNETVLLDNNLDNSRMRNPIDITETVLLNPNGDTEVLVVDDTVMLEKCKAPFVEEQFVMIEDIVLVHTTEIIQTS